MGFGFIIVIHLTLIFLLAAGIAFLGAIITYLLSSKERRTKNVVFSIISPFIGLYIFYFTALIGTIVVAENKKVDPDIRIGRRLFNLGDTWQVPVSDKCRLIFIDVPQNADIECDSSTVTISGISYIAQLGTKIYAETNDRKYFRMNTITKKLEEFPNNNDLGNALLTDGAKLVPTSEFYSTRKSELLGHSRTIVYSVAFIISIYVLYRRAKRHFSYK